MAKAMPSLGGGRSKPEKPKFSGKSSKDDKPARAQRSKKFCVSKISTTNEGKKIIIYGRTGMGKSTLAALAPRPVFLCPDNGLADLDHPRGGEFDVIPDIETFQDLRDVVRDHSLFEDFDTIVIDHLTLIQNSLCVDHVVENIKKEKGGKAKSITDFGWAKGYEHVYDQLRLFQTDLDKLVLAGKNVIVLCQLGQTTKTDSTYGEYWFDHPDLYDKKNSKVVAQWVAWASYVFKIDWASVEIDAENKTGTASDYRAIFTKPEFSFEAKARGSKFKEHPYVDFDEESDDTLWTILFDEQ